MIKYINTSSPTSKPMKVCSKCKVEQPIENYSKRSNRPSGIQSWCKTCERESRRKYYKPHEAARRRHKLNDEEYNNLMLSTTCDICETELTKKCIDHDHITGRVRGVLCNNCNTALGLVGDNTETLTKMVEYLTEKHEEELPLRILAPHLWP